MTGASRLSKIYQMRKALNTQLQRRLKKIKRFFDVNETLSLDPTRASIAEYYRINKIPYSLFHSSKYIHMGLSWNGKFTKSDLLEQVKIVEKYLPKKGKVLELAAGRGGNSVYLAGRNPQIEFYGLDLPKGQFGKSLQKSGQMKNLHMVIGD